MASKKPPKSDKKPAAKTDKKTVKSEKRHEDIILPFMLEESSLRGRGVRLGKVVDTILTRHNYPEPVSRLLGEMLVLTSMLANTLKFDGIFTAQVNGDGPVRFIVVDAVGDGHLRGYAAIEEDAPEFHVSNDTDALTMRELLGKGYLAITVDQNAQSERYQGIVELTGETLSESVMEYFRQSEQIDVALSVAVGKSREGGRKGDSWEAGGIMLQCMPEQRKGDDVLFLDFNADSALMYGREEWNRAKILLRSVTKYELLDPFLPMPELLYRLFNEEGVRVYEPSKLHAKCRCSRERVELVLKTLPRDDINDMFIEGKITVTCQFCNKDEVFTEAQVKVLMGE